MQSIKKIIRGFCLGCLLLINFLPNALADNSGEQLEAILPDLSGPELLQEVAKEYAPEQTLGYNRGRDVMYTTIDNHDGVVMGIYTGYSVNIDPRASNPRNITNQNNMNAEHIYPQSKGATGSARSDLHSLFPAYNRVNSERSNNPFAESDDLLTNKWFRDEQQLPTKPTEFIEEYSESLTGELFEPREDKKGDVARAMFYFYTVYRFQADAEDPSFFPGQRETLCQWNFADPVDEAEIARSHLVAEYQGNDNPFIIDSTLAARTYCQ
ncbi:MAG: endonuclease I family protein [Xenococcaceae cyanobacterium]